MQSYAQRSHNYDAELRENIERRKREIAEERKKKMETQEPTITVSVSRKIGLPNYGSADAFVSVSGIKQGATAEEIAALMDTGKLAWSVLTAALKEKVEATLAEYGGK